MSIDCCHTPNACGPRAPYVNVIFSPYVLSRTYHSRRLVLTRDIIQLTAILRSCLHLIFILRKTNPQPHTYHTVSACSDRLLTPITWYSHLFSHSFFIWTIGPRPSHGSHLVILTFWFSISHNTRDVKISQFHVIKPINACFTKSRSFCAHFLCTDMCRCMFL